MRWIGVELKPSPYISIDIEFVSLDNPMPLGIAVAIGNEAQYFFDTRDEMCHAMIDNADLVIMQNVASDLPLLKKLGYTVKDYDDTMLMAYSAGILNKDLESLSMNILGKENPKITTLWSKPDQGNIGISHTEIGELCMLHAIHTYELWDTLPYTWLYRNIDKPSIELVMEMEHWGVEVDQYRLTCLEHAAVVRAKKLEEQIKDYLGNINLASPPQVLKALQAKGIIGTRKVGSAKGATDKAALQAINHPITNALLQWRSEMKTIQTYVAAFRQVDHMGRLHTHFGYTNSGRWSNSDPNLQNLTRDEKFKEEDESN